MTTQPVNNKTAVGKSPPSWNQIRVLLFSIASVYPSAGRTATTRGIHYSYTFLKPVPVDRKPSRAYSAPPRLSIDPADVIRSLPSPDTPLPFTESPVEPVIASLDNAFSDHVLANCCDKLPVVDEPAVHPAAQDPVTAIQSPVIQQPATPTSDKLLVESVERAPVSQPLAIDSLPDVSHTPETPYPTEPAEGSTVSPTEASTGLTTPVAESPLFEDKPPSTLPKEAFAAKAEQLAEPEPLVAQELVPATEAEQLPETPVAKDAPVVQEVSAAVDDVPAAPEPTPLIEQAHPIKPSPTSSSRLPILRSNSTPMTPDKRRTSKIPAARPTMSFSLKTASKVDLKAKPAESKLKSQPSTPLPSRAIPRPESPRPSSPRPSPRPPVKSASSNVLSSPRPVSRMREADVPMAKKTGKKKDDEDEEDKPPARLTVQEKRRREAMRAQQIKLWRVREEREARDARTVARRKMMEEGANEVRRRRQLANGATPTTTTNTPLPPRRAVKFNLKRNKVIEITPETIE